MEGKENLTDDSYSVIFDEFIFYANVLIVKIIMISLLTAKPLRGTQPPSHCINFQESITDPDVLRIKSSLKNDLTVVPFFLVSTLCHIMFCQASTGTIYLLRGFAVATFIQTFCSAVLHDPRPVQKAVIVFGGCATIYMTVLSALNVFPSTSDSIENKEL